MTAGNENRPGANRAATTGRDDLHPNTSASRSCLSTRRRATFLNEPPAPAPAPVRLSAPLSNMRPPRVRCECCDFRYEILPQAAQRMVACPKCHVVATPEQEPLDEKWWQWTSGQVAPVAVSNVTPTRRAAAPAKAKRSIGVQV